MRIDIYSDLVCPWCFIGKRRLDRVLQGPVGEDIQLRWKPYQLHPSLPTEGVERAPYLQSRYGDAADPAHVPSRIASEAQEEGIELNFAAMQRIPNTQLGHRLMTYALPFGLQHELAEVLFRYYFVEGQDVGAKPTLLSAAQAVGLDAAGSEAALQDPELAAQVKAELAEAADAGISGVPCFMLAGTFALPGVQTPEVMEKFIERAKQRLG
jgi:predicted DsbA family dithiol-disulfide isomerase